MTTQEQRVTTVAVPRGHCRKCREKVELSDMEIPRLTRNGRLVAKGLCDICETPVTTFYTPSALERLPVRGLSQINVALVSIGMAGSAVRLAAVEQETRADEMLRLQRELKLTHRQLSRIFNLCMSRVATALAGARRREREAKDA